ncbi:hypothetical protein [Streptomyces prunicolor]|uniref:hypothetical protein n=1 Tax=Streptomyces prunicolor TaxID=67348 RepID=UPI0034064A24
MPTNRTRRNLWLDRAQWAAFQERAAESLLAPAVTLEYLLDGYADRTVTVEAGGPAREPGRGRTSIPLADVVHHKAAARAEADGLSLSVVCDALIAAYVKGTATLTVTASGTAAA